MFYLPNSVFEKLSLLQFSSCSCLTKTPELKYHQELCKYRLAAELKQELEKWKAPLVEAMPWPKTSHRVGAELVKEEPFYCGIAGKKMVFCSTCPGRECKYGNKEKKHD